MLSTEWAMTENIIIQIQRTDTGWMSVSCGVCRQMIWSGEEAWWSYAKLYLHDFFKMIERHIHR